MVLLRCVAGRGEHAPTHTQHNKQTNSIHKKVMAGELKPLDAVKDIGATLVRCARVCVFVCLT